MTNSEHQQEAVSQASTNEGNYREAHETLQSSHQEKRRQARSVLFRAMDSMEMPVIFKDVS